MSLKIQNTPVLLELTFPAATQGCICVTKTPNAQLAAVVHNVLGSLLAAPK